ncbi:MAG: cysteine--tRNA ligase [Nanoarchaeota archaeon]|nr:cysteine--tRNA ligase [Nanoarchaeota archaeon]
MALEIYNTLTKKKEEFIPNKKGKVNMYVCGPTVNDVPHLGHALGQIVFDAFRKYLIFIGYKVKFVSNITDIEDKIIKKSNELGISIKELTNKNIKAHSEDYKKLGVLKPDIRPKATEYVKEMINLIQILEKKHYTYFVKNDGVYFDISKFKDYGKLSGIDLTKLKKGIRCANLKTGLEKKDDKDFVLWKFSKPEEPSWNSPWGKGRPGWHIECSAMTHEILGNPFDIHGGGQDLIFPHHEDEIAQSEAGYEKKMCNYWMHNGMVNIDKIKMSKSLGNFTTIEDVLKDYSGEIIRYFVLNTHYRKPRDFSLKKLDEVKISLEKLKNACQKLTLDKISNKKYLEEFKKIMNQDFNTSGAINLIWKLLKDKNAKGKYATIKEIDKIFGFKLLEKEKTSIPKEIKEFLKQREEARKDKDFKKSDELRDKINKLGFIISDSSQGQTIKRV